MSSAQKQMFEGVGAPVNVAQIDAGNIDPTLDSCCQREIESNRKRDAVETQLRKHDRVTKAENQRRQHEHQPSSLPVGGYNYNAYNLIQGMSFGSGCRCCYDPNGDGGEYELLAETKRERGIGDVILCGNVEEEAKEIRHAEDNNSDSDSDDEFDYLLDDDLPGTGAASNGYDDLRRAELENVARHHEVARYHGYGVHRQMHPQRLFASAGLGADVVRDRVCPKGSVVHLYDAYSPVSVSLDICLEDMGTRYAGTKFVRGVGITSVLYADENGNAEWKKGDLPMLVALRDGRVVATSSGLRDFYRGSETEVESKVVEQWLEYAGVLHTSPPPYEALCKIRPEEEMLLQNMRKLNELGVSGGNGEMLGGMGSELGRRKEEDIEEERAFDCGVSGCNKCFYHEHVGVSNEAQDGLLVSESQVASSTD